MNVEIYNNNNNIESDVESSIGILGQNYLDNVTVFDNDFKLTAGKPLNILYVNTEEEHENHQFSFTGNTSENYVKAVVSSSHNIDIIDNTFTGAGINIDKESNNIKVEGNTVTTTVNNSTLSISNSTNIEIITNTFDNTSNGTLSIGATFNNSTNIVFKGNTVNALGINYGMYVADTNEAILIHGNTLQNVSTFRAPLHFLGSNSEIINNIFINSNNKDAYYEGDNNIISENRLNP